MRTGDGSDLENCGLWSLISDFDWQLADDVGRSRLRQLPQQFYKWSPLRHPACPACGDLSGHLNNATSRLHPTITEREELSVEWNCLLATDCSYRSRGSAFHPQRELGDAKARDSRDPEPVFADEFLSLRTGRVPLPERSGDCGHIRRRGCTEGHRMPGLGMQERE